MKTDFEQWADQKGFQWIEHLRWIAQGYVITAFKEGWFAPQQVKVPYGLVTWEDERRYGDTHDGVSLIPTPYAVRCRIHGLLYLVDAEYDRQMAKPDALWVCPICGREAEWDDEVYESTLGQ